MKIYYNYKYEIKAEISYDILDELTHEEFPEWVYNSYYGKVFIAWLYALKEDDNFKYICFIDKEIYFSAEFIKEGIAEKMGSFEPCFKINDGRGSTSFIELNTYRLIDNTLYQIYKEEDMVLFDRQRKLINFS
jgi:hypothetical protein